MIFYDEFHLTRFLLINSSKKNTSEKRKHNSSNESEEELNKTEINQKYKSEKKGFSYAINEKNLKKYPKNINSYASQEKTSSADHFRSGVKKSEQSSRERKKLSPSYSKRYKEESANSRKKDSVSPNDRIKYIKGMNRDRNRASKHRERSPILRSYRRYDE